MFASRRRALLASTSGNVAIMFALAVVPASLLVAGAVELTGTQSERARLQAAADAAALAAAREYLINANAKDSVREEKARKHGEALFDRLAAQASARIQDPKVTFTFSDDAEITARAVGQAPMTFGRLLGKPYVDIAVGASSIAGDMRPIEIVLVLDNTASMFDSDRMTLMRDAAINFVDRVFDESVADGLVRVGVVPWSSMVNIDSPAPRAHDRRPAASVNPPAAGTRTPAPPPSADRLGNLLHPNTGERLTSAELDSLFAPVGWRGCIRAADGEVRVSRHGSVTAAITDDIPPGGMRWRAGLVPVELDYDRVKDRNCCTPPRQPKPKNPGSGPVSPTPPDGGGAAPTPSPPPSPRPPPPPPPPPPRGPQGFLDLPNTPFPRYADASPWERFVAPLRVPATSSCTVKEHPQDTGEETLGGEPVMSCGTYDTGMVECVQDDGRGLDNTYLPRDMRCTRDGRTWSDTLEACVSDPNEFGWLSRGGAMCPWNEDVLPWNQNKKVSGPNLNCPTPILPLSGNRAQVIETLDRMYPVPGGTQADVGLLWGLRVLSDRDEWATFFGTTGDLKPGAFDPTETRKVMVLLTDGENTAPIDFEGYYGCTEKNRKGTGGCWRSPSVESLSDDVLDTLTEKSCAAIRSTYGVETYTIALDIPPGRAQRLLEGCADDLDKFFNITSAELDETFSKIVSRDLRLTR